MSKKPSVATDGDKALTKTSEDLPAVAGADDDEAQYAGAGMETVKPTDLIIPRLTILQQLSPQLNSKKSEYIEGAKIGQICDVAMNEIYPDGIVFLPVLYRKDYLEWAPRASGKGLVAIHSDPAVLEACNLNEKRQPITQAGNYIAETAQFYGLNLTADGRKCFIPMASTQLKKARQWMTMATSIKLKRADGSPFSAPLFYKTYLLHTADESNNEGDWSGWKITPGKTRKEFAELMGAPDDSIRKEAISLYEAMMSGKARADMSDMQEQGRSDAGASGDDARM